MARWLFFGVHYVNKMYLFSVLNGLYKQLALLVYTKRKGKKNNNIFSVSFILGVKTSVSWVPVRAPEAADPLDQGLWVPP